MALTIAGVEWWRVPSMLLTDVLKSSVRACDRPWWLPPTLESLLQERMDRDRRPLLGLTCGSLQAPMALAGGGACLFYTSITQH